MRKEYLAAALAGLAFFGLVPSAYAGHLHLAEEYANRVQRERQERIQEESRAVRLREQAELRRRAEEERERRTVEQQDVIEDDWQDEETIEEERQEEESRKQEQPENPIQEHGIPYPQHVFSHPVHKGISKSETKNEHRPDGDRHGKNRSADRPIIIRKQECDRPYNHRQ